jgi:Ribbon-helix-helix protein, copG family
MRTGRPIGRPSRKYTRTLSVSLTDEEYERLQKYRAKYGVNINWLLRKGLRDVISSEDDKIIVNV